MKKLVCMILILMMCIGSVAFAEEAERPEIAWDFGVPLTDVLSDYALLVNRDNLLDKSYEPANKVKISNKQIKLANTGTAMYLDEQAAKALEEMFNAAKLVFEYQYVNENGKTLTATYDEQGMVLYLKSAFRSYGTQNTSYYNRLTKNGGYKGNYKDQSDDSMEELVAYYEDLVQKGYDDGFVAPPGASEHQTGLAADVLNADYKARPRMTQDFEWTPEAQWMKENCADYGFILRYTKSDEAITKTAYEPWHFRYVGESIAKYVMGREITFEEFAEESKAAYESFISRGGDVDAWLAYEMAHLNQPPESRVLEETDETGDHEVSFTVI